MHPASITPEPTNKCWRRNLGITHPRCISLEVIGLGANLLGQWGITGGDGPQRAHQFFDFPLIQQALLVDLHPSFLLDFLVGIQLARHLPQMLASMVEVDNLNRVREVFGDQSPDPYGSIADYHLLFRAAPTTFYRFQIDALAKLFSGFDGSGVAGGIRIQDRLALLIPGGLREHTPQLDLPCMSWLALGLAWPTHRLFLHYGNSGPVHLHIQDGNRLADQDG